MAGRARQVRRGKSERTEHEQRVSVAAGQPHRKIAKGEHALDVRLECPLGRLAFLGIISTEQYEAGKRYRDIVAAYMVSIEAPAEAPPSHEECVRRRENYQASYEAVMRTGYRPTKAVSRVAVFEEEPLDEYTTECLKVGLSALEGHYSAVKRERRVIPFSEFRPIM